MRRPTIVWVGLLLATAVTWLIGESGGAAGGDALLQAIVIVVAFGKARFVAMEFMEVAFAPIYLRVLVDAWALLVGGGCLLALLL